MRIGMLVIVALLAGCGAGRPAPDSAREPWAAAAQCMRANGFPDFPDPVERDGQWGFPASVNGLVKQPAAECQEQFARIGAIPARTQRPVGVDEMAKLRAWAACVRTNGLPDWPDPDSDGTFRPATAPTDDDPAWRRADEACRHLEPGPIQVDPGPGARATKAAG
ncbi:hypothetical protein [Dactylosporangium sp. CS-033363]|uniref:hypothetical protein n=1 Tax=Dactylosporangium sp. CS-033363 TaxID=3239935 RepID=UPI003D9482F9